jgi:hypothetical protein
MFHVKQLTLDAARHEAADGCLTCRAQGTDGNFCSGLLTETEMAGLVRIAAQGPTAPHPPRLHQSLE